MSAVQTRTRTEMNVDLIHDLLKQYRVTKDKRLKEQIVKECMPLVIKIANNLARRSTDPVEDLIQVGSIGLIKGIENFDATREAKCTTYFSHLIAGEMRHYCRDKSMLFRAPRELVELNFRINRIINSLIHDLGRDPTNLELAQALDVTPKKITDAYEVDRRRTVFSLNQTVSGNGESEDQIFLDTIVDIKELNKSNIQEYRMLLHDALSHIQPQSRDIIECIYFKEMTQTKYSQLRQISQMQTSRRVRAALAELRQYFHQNGHQKNNIL